MANQIIYSANQVFTGNEVLPSHAVIVDDGVIKEILPSAELSKNAKVALNADLIAPAFIDLQVYGASGKLFGAFPEPASLRLLTEHNFKTGTALCLPTLATNSSEIFRKGIDAVRKYWSDGGEGVFGLHLEGPWINSEKKGAHIESFIHSPTLREAEELLNYGKGVIKMITLAPEVCPDEVFALLKAHDIIISAGHSSATYEEANRSFGMGVSAVTHLFNAMSPFHHRSLGLVGAVLDHPSVMASIIPDGYHVDWAALRIAKTIMKERLFAITDAVTETQAGPYPHQPAGDKYESGGILSGSMLTMMDVLRNLVKYGNIELEEALRMCSTYPARLIKLDNVIGFIKKGDKPNLIAIDSALQEAFLIKAG